jgi:guanylate kinase
MGGAELLADTTAFLAPEAFGIILIGASGTGKSTTAAELQSQGIVQVEPTYATREKRPIEAESPPCDHVFIDKQKFDDYVQAGRFIDKRPMYGGHYGVPFFRRPPEGSVPLMVLKPSFVESVLKYYPHMRTYQIEASAATVIQRMRGRGQEESDIAERMRKYALETAMGRRLADYVLKNEGRLENTVQRLAKRIHKDRASHSVLELVG